MTSSQRDVYRLMAADPDRSLTALDGFGAAYRKGYRHPERRPYPRSSLADAAWRAGRDRHREELRAICARLDLPAPTRAHR